MAQGVDDSATVTANIMVAASRLIPLGGTTIVAHSTRNKILDLLDRSTGPRTMIVDVTALVWNFDTYAIVGGKPSPVKIRCKNQEELNHHLDLEEDSGCKTNRRGKLFPKTEVNKKPTWVPTGAKLIKTEKLEEEGAIEFTFEPLVDPNNDRLNVWEQDVKHDNWIAKNRAEMVTACMHNMVRFFELDKIICWDLSWGIWEGVVRKNASGMNISITGNDADSYFQNFPSLSLVDCSSDSKINFPALDKATGVPIDVDGFMKLAKPITTDILKQGYEEANGYYLLGGSTYTMSLFHNMWNRQKNGGHIDTLNAQLKSNTLFYMGHSAGAIMSGPNILTATWKCIDAFSHSIQPYNAPYVKLPPSENVETFFIKEENQNDLYESRCHMLKKMKQYNAWQGFRVVECLTFPHYDSRPTSASFPQSAETYLRATDDDGKFCQQRASFKIGKEDVNSRLEPEDVQEFRTKTNENKTPVPLIANGHSVCLIAGGSYAKETQSPAEEGQAGPLNWDTYMPAVGDDEQGYGHYNKPGEPRRSKFASGVISQKAVAGDRSIGDRNDHNYNGSRVISRLQGLGLPLVSSQDLGLFRQS